MTYREFSLAQVKIQFNLELQTLSLFSDIQTIVPSKWLTENLNIGTRLTFTSANEKARSKFIVAPILMELERKNPEQISIFSGMRLDVDEVSGLKGECDFLLSRKPSGLVVEAPVFCLVEAKKMISVMVLASVLPKC